MLVNYERNDAVATITLDDGKVNVLSSAMVAAINEALDRAEADGATVLLTGRPGVFSAGFDLATLRAGGENGAAMVRAGFELAYRVLSFPRPVVIACTGHAIAMGTFLLLSGDYRVGAAGAFKFTANEVALGLVMPDTALEILRQRLTPAAFNRAVLLSEAFEPETAVAAGFLDRVVAPPDLLGAAREVALAASTLDSAVHAASKLRARRATLAALRSAIDADTSALS